MSRCFINDNLGIPVDNWTCLCEGENAEQENYIENTIGGQLNRGGKTAQAILSRRKKDLPLF